MAKIKYTLIQGNFYERSPFYMDSCALSPMASLLTSAGILGQHDILVLADNPSTSGKVGFYPSCNFSNLLPPEWLRMTWNGQFSMAKIKYTLIQGNFYERSPFYMDSCALSPMASLLTSAGILGQHDILVLADDPSTSGKVGFYPSCNFSNLFPLKWLIMTQNGQFHPIPNFSNLFPPKWLRMTRNGQFCLICNFSDLFPLKWLRMTWNGQFCPICNFSNLFPPTWLRMTQNGQFCVIYNFSDLFPLKWLIMTQKGQFHPIPNFSNLFPPKWLRMTQNGQFHPIHNFSNLFLLKWLRMANFAQFATFPIFFH